MKPIAGRCRRATGGENRPIAPEIYGLRTGQITAGSRNVSGLRALVFIMPSWGPLSSKRQGVAPVVRPVREIGNAGRPLRSAFGFDRYRPRARRRACGAGWAE